MSQSKFDNAIFCPMPFLALDVSSMGEVSYCCESSMVGPTHHTISPTKLFENEDFLSARHYFLNNAVPVDCANCFKLEQRGLQSKRQKEMERLNTGQYGDFNPHDSPKLRFLSYRVGNKCNLKCVMCNPESSHLIEIEEAKIEERLVKPACTITIDLDYDYSELRALYVGGGEPFLSPDFAKLMTKLVAFGHQDLNISINTNLSMMAFPRSRESFRASFRAPSAKFRIPIC